MIKLAVSPLANSSFSLATLDITHVIVCFWNCRTWWQKLVLLTYLKQPLVF